DGRLVEWIDAEKPAGEDRLQHEVHQECAERALIEAVYVKDSHRSAGLSQRPGDAVRLGRDEVAGMAARHFVEASLRRKLGINARTCPGRRRPQHGDQMLARAVHEELKLAVLIEGPQARDRSGSHAVLAQALGPELNIPVRE